MKIKEKVKNRDIYTYLNITNSDMITGKIWSQKLDMLIQETIKETFKAILKLVNEHHISEKVIRKLKMKGLKTIEVKE